MTVTTLTKEPPATASLSTAVPKRIGLSAVVIGGGAAAGGLPLHTREHTRPQTHPHTHTHARASHPHTYYWFCCYYRRRDAHTRAFPIKISAAANGVGRNSVPDQQLLRRRCSSVRPVRFIVSPTTGLVARVRPGERFVHVFLASGSARRTPSAGPRGRPSVAHYGQRDSGGTIRARATSQYPGVRP